MVVVLPDGYLRLDPAHRIIRVWYREDLAWWAPRAQILGRPLAEAFPWWLADAYGLALELAQAFDRPIPFSYEWTRNRQTHARLAWARGRADGGAEIHVTHLGTRRAGQNWARR